MRRTVIGLRRHVPDLAVTWDLDAPGRRWRQVDGTLVFADISGFTALSERLAQRGRIGAEELVETLSRVFGAMLDTAAERDGMLLKFGGDALLFLFHGPDHARRACATAVEMRIALRAAAAVPTSVGRLKLSMSVGVHSDLIDFFLVGSPHRELVLLGPAATEVAETEGAAEAGQIVVSPSTAAWLPATATRDRGDGRLLLRWRRPPEPADGATPARPVGEDVVRGLFPARLGEVLATAVPDPEHRVATISFTRFSGTDAMLADRGHDAVAEALHVTLSAVEDAFAAEDVTLLAVDLDKDGGKFFAGSGVPHASEDDEASMIRALQTVLAQDLPLPLQSGVSRGHVFAAEVGTRRRAAYSAMGDTTNTAARICAKTEPGHLFAHPTVLEHARSLFDSSPVGPFTFKGKKEPLMLLDVGQETGTRSDDETDELALLGRDDEIARLRAAIESVTTHDSGGVMTVTGATGMGKSRLVREALEPFADDVTVVWSRAEPYGATSPYRMFRDTARHLLGIERGDPQQMAAELLDAVRATDRALLPLAPLLAAVAHVDVPATPEADAIDPQFRPDRTADIVIGLLETGAPGPMVLLAEDAHWADEASSHLLARIATACSEHPWLLVVARRGDEEGFVPDGGETLTLEPLDDEAIRALVIAATEDTPLRPHDIDTVVARAGGMPLFVEEITRTVREVGSLDAVPESLTAALAAQVDALDPLARRVLMYASVLGRSFRRKVLRQVLDAEGVDLDRATRERVMAFLEPDGRERLRFRNALVRDVTYEGLAYRLRTRLHLSAGAVLESLFTDEAAIDADTLSMHFWRAGDHARIWRYALMAAERAERAYANADAAVQFERALDAARRLPDVRTEDRVDTLIRLGDVRELAGEFEGSLDAYRRALALVPSDNAVRRAQLILRRARAKERVGRFSDALRDVGRARRLVADASGADARKVGARLAAFAAVIRVAQERPRDVIRVASEAVALAREADEPEALGRALMMLDWAHIELGEPDRAVNNRQALEIFESIGALARVASAKGNLGYTSYFEGRWTDAVQLLDEARADFLRIGDRMSAAFASGNLADILISQGRYDEAADLLRDAVRVMRASGFADGAAFAEMLLARVELAEGRVDEAEERLRRCREEFEALHQQGSVSECSVFLAECHVAAGDPAAALAALPSDDHDPGMQPLEPRIALVRARSAHLQGDDDRAVAELTRGLEAARSQHLDYEAAMLVLASTEISDDWAAEVDEAVATLTGLGVRVPEREGARG